MKRAPVLVGLAFAAGASQAYVLDFGTGPSAPALCSSSTDGSGAAVECTTGNYINQAYGDVAGVVDVGYSAPRIVTDSRSLRWWSDSYNDLYGVLWAEGGDGDSRAQITLTPQGGSAVTLTHFDLGAWVMTTRFTTVNVYEIGNSTPVYTFSGDVGSGATHSAFDVSISSAVGLQLEWQDSAYNVGIDNVTFTVGVVPEPSTYAMLLAGLAVGGALSRRRRG